MVGCSAGREVNNIPSLTRHGASSLLQSCSSPSLPPFLHPAHQHTALSLIAAFDPPSPTAPSQRRRTAKFSRCAAFSWRGAWEQGSERGKEDEVHEAGLQARRLPVRRRRRQVSTRLRSPKTSSLSLSLSLSLFRLRLSAVIFVAFYGIYYSTL